MDALGQGLPLRDGFSLFVLALLWRAMRETEERLVMKRSSGFVLPVCILLSTAFSCAAAPPAPAQGSTPDAVSTAEIDSVPCNPDASQDANSVLRYLAAPFSTENGRAIVGQNCYHGNEITDASPLNPRVMDDAGPVRSPKTWDGDGSPTDRSGARLSELLDPSTPVYANWRKSWTGCRRHHAVAGVFYNSVLDIQEYLG
jgi:hypothetical protein